MFEPIPSFFACFLGASDSGSKSQSPAKQIYKAAATAFECHQIVIRAGCGRVMLPLETLKASYQAFTLPNGTLTRAIAGG